MIFFSSNLYISSCQYILTMLYNKFLGDGIVFFPHYSTTVLYRYRPSLFCNFLRLEKKWVGVANMGFICKCPIALLFLKRLVFSTRLGMSAIQYVERDYILQFKVYRM